MAHTVYYLMILNSKKFMNKCRRSGNKTLVLHMICRGSTFSFHNESKVGTWKLKPCPFRDQP
jgi:hypothetical protein